MSCNTLCPCISSAWEQYSKILYLVYSPVNILDFVRTRFLSQIYNNKNMSSDRFTCIQYKIANSSWHFGPNGSLWTGLSPTKQYIDLSSASLRSIYYFVGDIPVHKLPYDPQCHELFVKYTMMAVCCVPKYTCT